MMKFRFTLRWWLWSAAAILFAVAFFLFYFSSKTYLIPLKLNPGETVHSHIYRPLSYQAMNTELWFKQAGHSRPELGAWSPNTLDTDNIRFEHPGETVIVEITANGDTIRREALPAYGSGQAVIVRELIGARSDDDPHTFHRNQCAPNCLGPFPAGIQQIQIKVLSAGTSLQGEKVQLAIQPPLGFKTSEKRPAYILLWLMYFYPFYLGILSLWLLILLASSFRPHHPQNPSETD